MGLLPIIYTSLVIFVIFAIMLLFAGYSSYKLKAKKRPAVSRAAAAPVKTTTIEPVKIAAPVKIVPVMKPVRPVARPAFRQEKKFTVLNAASAPKKNTMPSFDIFQNYDNSAQELAISK